jgi:uncharacterized protein YukE
MKSIRTLSFLGLVAVMLFTVGDTYGRGDGRGEIGKDRGRMGNLVHFFVRNDSCREVLLAAMSEEDAAAYTTLVTNAKDYHTQIEALRAQMREARAAGDREAFRALATQMRELHQKMKRTQHAMGELLRKYQGAAKRVFIDCGPHRKRDRGDKGETGERIEIRASLSPNPATAEGTNLLLTLQAATTIGVTISDRAGNVISEIAQAEYAPGLHSILISTANMQPGMYYVRLVSGGHVQTLKLMVQ